MSKTKFYLRPFGVVKKEEGSNLHKKGMALKINESYFTHIEVIKRGTLLKKKSYQFSEFRQLLKKNEHLLCKLINFSEENLISGKNEEIIQIPSLGSFPSKNLDRLPIWKKIVTKIITSQGGYRRSLTKNQGFPATFKKEKSEMLDLISWCTEQDWCTKRSWCTKQAR